ncbi:MAG: ThuA domain-containing protein [Chloroflexi bacterium]|nr:MAG: ThuA domain-containing protein [Chloroflexota bacterium]
MRKRKALLYLGGQYHDFPGFAAACKRFFYKSSWTLDATFDLSILERLLFLKYDLVIGYTCFTKSNEDKDQQTPSGLTIEQVDGLVNYVHRGGGLLGIHSATVIGESNSRLSKLFGAEFLTHPPAFSFQVVPVSIEHPMTADITAFEVFDEFYIHRFTAPVDIHMISIYEGAAHPFVWSRQEEQGRVACITMGHSSQVWSLDNYNKLVLQSALWVSGL